MKQIPNLFTLLNLFLGTMAIVYVTQPGLIPMYRDLGNGQIVPDVDPKGLNM